MRYFHCPSTYRSKPYGCGRGPYNATQAMLDMWGKCKCGARLVPYHPPRIPLNAPDANVTCAVRGIDGSAYCTAPVKRGSYCARHGYLEHSSADTRA